MTSSFRDAGLAIQFVMQRLAFVLIIALGVGLSAYCLSAAFELVPWLVLPLQFGETVYVNAGKWLQLTLAALAFGLMFFLPSNRRIMALETSHRKFHMTMRDVAKAYAAAHRADREGVFTLSSEFDSVRERIAFLRDHPDLGDLEPSVLEVAAQMSHVSRELAQTYSDSNLARARDFLTARQQEIDDFNDRLAEAKAVATEIRQWHMQVSLEEDIGAAQLARLREELVEILPEILPEAAPTTAAEPGPHAPEPSMPEQTAAAREPRVVAMNPRQAAE
ncbi:DNA repair protein [Citreicella sp. C3M06]|uniref:DNA repair protein n=1 Tax=Citreicella sp. C3M06 TaxID=2841564 RepID=UPI001C0A44F4|nr:DNA repair protein [Citreicella sp. C3M06]MBU2963672.1 DNA repair protein [Citreicella sp. C3M06]